MHSHYFFQGKIINLRSTESLTLFGNSLYSHIILFNLPSFSGSCLPAEYLLHCCSEWNNRNKRSAAHLQYLKEINDCRRKIIRLPPGYIFYTELKRDISQFKKHIFMFCFFLFSIICLFLAFCFYCFLLMSSATLFFQLQDISSGHKSNHPIYLFSLFCFPDTRYSVCNQFF